MGSDMFSMSFVVGQHETKRTVPVTPALVQLALDNNYDLVTAPVTTSAFQSKVLGLLSSHLSNSKEPKKDALKTLETSANYAPLTIPPLSPEDSDLTPNEATTQIIGVVSKWIDLCSPDPLIADVSRQVLDLEVAYAAFCGIPFLILPAPKLHHAGAHAEGVMYYARAVKEALENAPYMQLHVSLEMIDNPAWESTEMGDLSPFARAQYTTTGNPSEIDLFGTWEVWDTIRRSLALYIPKGLPQVEVQTRWVSESVRYLMIPAFSFETNAKGYPVLSRNHQALISRFMQLKMLPWLLICDASPLPRQESIDLNNDADALALPSPTPAEAAKELIPQLKTQRYDPLPHLSYIRNLQDKQPPRSPMEQFGSGYQDYLQAPLQPLTVNLESITYEVFEKDPIKYAWYEKAIAKALTDWVALKKPTSGPNGRVTVAVAGAGRGPLVTRALNASASTGIEIDMWLVEKNYNAFVLLQRHNKDTWGGRVNLVRSDMRAWKGPHRFVTRDGDQPVKEHYTVDILISELLGSFGDNELSPECLDGVEHVLAPTYGISIPASYSAHLTPISAPRLHADISSQLASNPAAPETPYVVLLGSFDFLSTEPAKPHSTSPSEKSPTHSPPSFEAPQPVVKTAWSFSHPNPNIPPQDPASSVIANNHNVRRTRLSFTCKNRGVCHGLAGYFESVLYEGVEISTNPVTMDAKSKDMISWFPIYFPLRTPLTVPPNSELVVTMYRQTDSRKVWYEWIVEVFALVEDTTVRAPSQSKQCAKEPMSFAKVAAVAPSTVAPIKSVRKTRIAMSELHSSIKDGCLM
ncbi:DEAH-box ATP-dependent RNA helicase prp43 [Ascosphaera pollenicola]|nr:DEAH-box ATP-dependent RNA helicase prp43 [Ascosphaera pollenicola]